MSDAEAKSIMGMMESCGQMELLLLPSTFKFLDVAWELGALGGWWFVGDKEVCKEFGLDYSMLIEPSEILSRMSGFGGSGKFRIGVFTDQLVEASHACLLMGSGEEASFYPALELALTVKYHFSVRYWSGHGFESVRHRSGKRQEIRDALDAYYAACSKAEDWIMASVQERRSIKFRREQAKQMTRLYQSVLLLSRLDAGSNELLESVLEQLTEHRRRLA
ncbi:hypothetical protein [Pseudoxanthomonas sp. z9]|uniref:hypothetical protein n=1 Tax=Pseudoxanthomonas sp. z9 TaxID=2584942 RepID=UPI001142DC32|nr:hypothetical protein [Pseudoxanthomonas sp. z9]